MQQLREVYSREFESPKFFGALIEARRDFVELRLRVAGEIGSLRQVLSQQAVFVRSSSPGAVRITEVNPHIPPP